MMKKTVQKSKDKGLCRRLTAILMVYAGLKITEIAEHLCAARSSVGRWINLFIQLGEIGLMTRKPGRSKGYPEKLIKKCCGSLWSLPHRFLAGPVHDGAWSYWHWQNWILRNRTGPLRPLQSISCGHCRFPAGMTPHMLFLTFPLPLRQSLRTWCKFGRMVRAIGLSGKVMVIQTIILKGTNRWLTTA
ncbi:helix-turn-helix domain-containing protein [Salmonella enterica]|nr:helix-turn-helix domain-containing protein [Salmonella enterica]